MDPTKKGDDALESDAATFVVGEAPPFVHISHSVWGPDGRYDLRAIDARGRVWRYTIHPTHGGVWRPMSTKSLVESRGDA